MYSIFTNDKVVLLTWAKGHDKHYTTIYYTILFYAVLYYSILYYTMLYYTILWYAMLCYIILVNSGFDFSLFCPQLRIYIGMYVIYLLDWLTILDKNQILILRLEDYSANLNETLHRVYNFLGVGMDANILCKSQQF